MAVSRRSTDSALPSIKVGRRTEWIYIDELLLRERRNLARRWWGSFGIFYGITLVLILLGWWRSGISDLASAPYLNMTLGLVLLPLLGATAGFLLWFFWINRRPMRALHLHYEGRPKSAFRVALACMAEAGWTPWEIDYDHQIAVAVAPDGAYEGIPPQVVTVFCAPVSHGTSEIWVQSRFVEATQIRDAGRANTANTRTFQRCFRKFASEAESPLLPSPHPLARLKGRLPEEQELALEALGRGRAQGRLWVTWLFISVIAAVLLHLQPWGNPALAWPLTFLAAGAFHFMLGHLWNAQERYSRSHSLATVIANPFPSRSQLWESVGDLARGQKMALHETLDVDTRVYRSNQPAIGYPGIYLILHTTKNDAGVEQLMAVAIPEWGVVSALMPPIYAPFTLMAFMQALRRGPEVEADFLRSLPELAAHEAGV